MQRNLKRLALALVISTSCFLGTVIWFESGKDDDHGNGERTPVARLNESVNDVQRKPIRRVIWESVSKNDDLFPGEAIRTATNSEAKIQLVKSGTVIHLEPDSLVVLEENENGLSLDFLQGNLLVQSTGDGDSSSLTLKAGSGEIKLTSADMSLSTDQNGKVNLEVYKGQAELQQGGKTIALQKDKTAQLSDGGVSVGKDLVQITSPRAGETVLLNLMRGEKLNLGFNPLNEGYSVTAELGSTRTSLKSVGSAVPGQSGKLSLTAKPGRWYLRLSAKSNNPTLPPLASTLLPVVIQPKSPPTLVEPAADTPVFIDEKGADVAFRWINRHKFEVQVLEIASDPRIKNLVKRERLNAEALTFKTPVPDGRYYWRVTGYLKVGGKQEGLSSPVRAFNVQSKWEVKPPELSSPANNLRLSHSDVQKRGVPLKWSQVSGVHRYVVLAQYKTAKGWETLSEQEIETTSLRLNGLKPGAYQWKVSSIDPRGGPAQSSKPFSFEVEEMAKLEWVDAPDEYMYPTPTPSLIARWKPMIPAPHSYRYRVTESSDVSGEAPWKSTKQPALDILLEKEGEYTAIVEAVNDKGLPLAQSDLKTFQVKRMPLLPAPQWAQSTPEILKSDAKGNLSFGWEEVEGAKQYLMILENEEGKVVDKKTISRTTASLNRLKPGQYKVKLKSVDGLQRPGEESQPKELVVPAVSDIRAPKIMNMKVK